MCEIKKRLSRLENKTGSGNYSETLISFFGKLRIRIPDDFIDFYKSSNGYNLMDDRCQLIFKAPEDFVSQDKVIFSRFSGVEWITEEYEKFNDDFFPKDMISFISLPVGKVVISCREECFGNIFYCETDLHPEQFEHPDHSDDIMRNVDYPNKPLPAAMFKVADSFTEFLNLLEVIE